MSLFHRLEALRRRGAHLAVRTDEGALSYAELELRARRAAGLLRALGVGPGDVVAVGLPRSLALLEAHLGCLAAGAVSLPLNDRYTDAERGAVLRETRPTLALLPDGAVADCPTVAASELRAALDAADPIDAVEVSGGAIAFLCATSGTTGRPKGVPLTHDNVAATVAALHEAWRWSEADVLVHALPLYHVHGLFVAQLGALWAGASAVWRDRFDAADALDAIDRERATLFMGVPTFYHRFLELPEHRWRLSSMRLFTSGSAPLPAPVHRAFLDRFGFAVLERYGMTETGIVLSNPYDGERRPGAVGFPLPGVRARIADPSGADVPPGEIGEIRIAGPSVFGGYTSGASPLSGGEMRTGDLGRVDADGYFHVVGREKELILVGGFNVFPAEVEAALAAHPAVVEAAVVGVPDADLGERVLASVVLRAPAPDLLDVAAARLAPYKRPRAVEVVGGLPRNAMGKLDRAVLRSRWTAPRVRPARPDEADLLAARNVLMARETEGVALDPETARRGARAVFARDVGARYFVAEIAGAVVGQCMVTTEWSDWRDRPVWWLQSVYVEPAARGAGAYRALHEAVVSAAREAGAAGVRLYVDRRNTPAAAVYRRVGMSGDHYLVFEQMFDEPPAAGHVP